jgi:hypothetical protein
MVGRNQLFIASLCNDAIIDKERVSKSPLVVLYHAWLRTQWGGGLQRSFLYEVL